MFEINQLIIEGTCTGNASPDYLGELCIAHLPVASKKMKPGEILHTKLIVEFVGEPAETISSKTVENRQVRVTGYWKENTKDGKPIITATTVEFGGKINKEN